MTLPRVFVTPFPRATSLRVGVLALTMLTTPLWAIADESGTGAKLQKDSALAGATLPKQVPYRGPMITRLSTSADTPRLNTATTSGFSKLTDFTVDINNRQHVQAFFNSIYTASEDTPLTFTGNVTACSSGTTNALHKNAIQLRINWYRELAGVTDNITFRNSYNASAQDAALIMAANNTLTHNPPSGFDCFTSTGADGAASSNLALGTLGWGSVDGYIEDPGSNNSAVGHRRWLLHPPTEEMGTGDVPATGSSPATNAIWIFDENVFAEGPTRDGYVAWPPPGFVPHEVVPARFSFGLKDADFTNTTVTMTRDGSPVSTTLEPFASNTGLNTLVWIPMGLDAASGEGWPLPPKDEVLNVQLNNVVVDGVTESFSYDINVFDAAASVASDVITTITGPATGEPNTAERFELNPVSFATGYVLRSGDLNNFTATEDAEGTDEFVIDYTDSGYSLFSGDAAATGANSLHLAHSIPGDQHVVIDRQIIPSASSQLRFASRLGFASPNQVARAQVSLDDGQSWTDVYSQAGDNGSGESGFTNRSISLADYASSTIMLRFSYDLLGGSYFPQSSAGVGFYVDDVEVSNAQLLTNTKFETLGKVDEFSYTPPTGGDQLIQIQYVGWEGFAGSAWGPAQTLAVSDNITATTALAASVLPASRSVFGGTASAFATIINGGAVTANDCRIVPQTNAPIDFSYQTTNPATNGLTGTANTPVNIAAGDYQTFALFLSPTTAFTPTEIALSFDCANSAPAPVTGGLNTLLLASGSGPVPDIIALAVAGATGIADIPGNTGTGVFAVATVNAGVSGNLTATASGPAGVSVVLCETNPTTGACISAVGPSVTTTINANATPTFGFFVTGSANVPFDPANNRVSVVFADSNGVTRGATSVAVRTN